MTKMHLTNMNNHAIVMNWTGQRIESNMRAIVQQCKNAGPNRDPPIAITWPTQKISVWRVRIHLESE